MLPELSWLTKAAVRPDEDVLKDVNNCLWHDDTTRAAERSALAVDVRAGQVFLTGHVRNVRYRQHVVDLVSGVQGVRAIHNALIADPDLLVAVAQALAADVRTGPAVIRVGVWQGWVQLAGEVPDAATRQAAEEVAARVPQVRGVLGLPHLPPAQSQARERRRALQPRVGQAVYATDGQAGRVTEVVINPQSRMVSHVVVAGVPEVNWLPVRGGWVVPMSAVAQAGDSGVFLADKLSALVARPAYDPADFRLPPAEWQLPFPYAAGEVRWIAQPDAAPAALPGGEFYWVNSLNRAGAGAPVAA